MKIIPSHGTTKKKKKEYENLYEMAIYGLFCIVLHKIILVENVFNPD